jgi:hypothetical protein
MKKRCAGLAIVVLSLVAFGVSDAQIALYGVIDPNTHNVTVSLAYVFVNPNVDTVPTPGWGGSSVDTFAFPSYPNWVDSVELVGAIDGQPNTSMFVSPKPDTWYRFMYGGIIAPRAMFYNGIVNVEEPRAAITPLQRLSVSPSVVTGQMTVRLQPVETGRPVVEVYDATGKVIRSLDCTAGPNGIATATWSREDEIGRLVPEGVYFCRYAASGVVAVRKVLVTH